MANPTIYDYNIWYKVSSVRLHALLLSQVQGAFNQAHAPAPPVAPYPAKTATNPYDNPLSSPPPAQPVNPYDNPGAAVAKAAAVNPYDDPAGATMMGFANTAAQYDNPNLFRGDQEVGSFHGMHCCLRSLLRH